MEKIEIYSSKKKAVLLLFGSIVFVTLGVFMLFGSNDVKLFYRIAGLLAILFFGIGIYAAVRMLMKKVLILTIDDFGLNFNSQKYTYAIPWENIDGFSVANIFGTKIIIINVNNSQYWLNSETNTIRKNMMKFNINNYESPFNISANVLEISHNKLIDLLNNCLKQSSNL